MRARSVLTAVFCLFRFYFFAPPAQTAPCTARPPVAAFCRPRATAPTSCSPSDCRPTNRRTVRTHTRAHNASATRRTHRRVCSMWPLMLLFFLLVYFVVFFRLLQTGCSAVWRSSARCPTKRQRAHSPPFALTDCPTSTASRGRARPDPQSNPAPCASASAAVGDGFDPVRSGALPSRALLHFCASVIRLHHSPHILPFISTLSSIGLSALSQAGPRRRWLATQSKAAEAEKCIE